jgi:hypothetical protein
MTTNIFFINKQAKFSKFGCKYSLMALGPIQIVSDILGEEWTMCRTDLLLFKTLRLMRLEMKSFV